LLVATILGFVGIAGFFGFALWSRDSWLGVIAVFMLMNCWSGLQHARALLQFAKLPRRFGFACPACKASPPTGDYWKCGKCGQAFDSFHTGAVCPHCAAQYATTKCLDCGATYPMNEWSGSTIHEGSRLPVTTI
jgi:DNA-directed RNA polymerase subunit RPC12/RpoP